MSFKETLDALDCTYTVEGQWYNPPIEPCSKNNMFLWTSSFSRVDENPPSAKGNYVYVKTEISFLFPQEEAKYKIKYKPFVLLHLQFIY